MSNPAKVARRRLDKVDLSSAYPWEIADLLVAAYLERDRRLRSRTTTSRTSPRKTDGPS